MRQLACAAFIAAGLAGSQALAEDVSHPVSDYQVVLYRNGALVGVFASAGQAAAYEKLEALLGGPGSGTPRAVSGDCH